MSYLVRRVAGRAPTPLLMLGLVLEGIGRLILTVLRRWWLAYPIGLVLLGWWLTARYGPAAVAALLMLAVGVVAVSLAAWQWLAPTSFDARLVVPVRSWRRRSYYAPRWAEVMSGCELVRGGVEPLLMSVRGGETVDELLVHMAPGQLVTDWRDRAPRLASALEARSVRVRRDGPRDVLLLVRHSAVSWRESRVDVEDELAEVVEQYNDQPATRPTVQAITEHPAPTEVHDVPRPGEGRAFPRKVR